MDPSLLPLPWRVVREHVLLTDAGLNARFDKHMLPPPKEAGFRRSLGQDLRARKHWRRALPNGAGLHVLEFDDHYLVHWDRFDPQAHLLGHLWHDARSVSATMVALLCAMAVAATIL